MLMVLTLLYWQDDIVVECYFTGYDLPGYRGKAVRILGKKRTLFRNNILSPFTLPSQQSTVLQRSITGEG